MARKTLAFHIEFELPPRATSADCVEYIKTALMAECGQRNPDNDPMFCFNRSSLEVRYDGCRVDNLINAPDWQSDER